MIALVAATVAISWLFCYCTLKCSFAWYLLLLCSSSARREQMDVVWAGCVCGHLLACAELLLPFVLLLMHFLRDGSCYTSVDIAPLLSARRRRSAQHARRGSQPLVPILADACATAQYRAVASHSVVCLACMCGSGKDEANAGVEKALSLQPSTEDTNLLFSYH